VLPERYRLGAGTRRWPAEPPAESGTTSQAAQMRIRLRSMSTVTTQRYFV